MQKLFSSFPRGWPGVGLLLLRVAVGLSLVVQGGACLAGAEAWSWAWMAGLLFIVTGASLLIGFLTPVAGALAGLLSAGLALSWLPSLLPEVLGGTPARLYVIIMAAAVLLIGPGAFSLDARLFGRREVVIPPPFDRDSPGLPRDQPRSRGRGGAA